MQSIDTWLGAGFQRPAPQQVQLELLSNHDVMSHHIRPDRLPHLLGWHGTSDWMNGHIRLDGITHPMRWTGTSDWMAWHIPCDGLAHPTGWHGTSPAMAWHIPCDGMAHLLRWHGASSRMDGGIAANALLFSSIGNPTKTGIRLFSAWRALLSDSIGIL